MKTIMTVDILITY